MDLVRWNRFSLGLHLGSGHSLMSWTPTEVTSSDRPLAVGSQPCTKRVISHSWCVSMSNPSAIWNSSIIHSKLQLACPPAHRFVHVWGAVPIQAQPGVKGGRKDVVMTSSVVAEAAEGDSDAGLTEHQPLLPGTHPPPPSPPLRAGTAP